MDRDCKNCVYHSSGSCSQWDCNFTTTNDVRNKAIDDFKKILTIEKIKEYAESDGFININNCSLMILDIAEQLKAGGNV